MKDIKNLLEQNPDKVNRSNFLELAKKDERGVPMSTGPHKVKLLRGEADTKKSFATGKEEEGITLYFDENGTEKKYFVPTYVNDKNSKNYGRFHYLFERFGGIEEGSILIMEYIKRGNTGYVEVREENQEIPIINADEEINEADFPTAE
jgi:hypothetical protein